MIELYLAWCWQTWDLWWQTCDGTWDSGGKHGKLATTIVTTKHASVLGKHGNGKLGGSHNQAFRCGRQLHNTTGFKTVLLNCM